MAPVMELPLWRGKKRMAHTDSESFLKSLGFPSVHMHQTFSHFDFTVPGRRVLVIGPMGSGKTEFASRIWRDAAVARQKGSVVRDLTATGQADRREVFFIRSYLDKLRFSHAPDDALSYRSGYIRCGDNIAWITDSFELEQLIEAHPTVGTYIIDEASFFDERLAYVIRNYSLKRGIMFVFPTLILNFRRDIFNPTARLMLEMATDVIPLTAYCEHPDCLREAFYTYRYYTIEGEECPALYFDPLIVVGGDTHHDSPTKPNYAARCDQHHYLPGKEYTFFHLKPLGEAATKGEEKGLCHELELLKINPGKSILAESLLMQSKDEQEAAVFLRSLKAAHIAEHALMYLFGEQNAIPEELLLRLVTKLELDHEYMGRVLSDNKRPVAFDQPFLF